MRMLQSQPWMLFCRSAWPWPLGRGRLDPLALQHVFAADIDDAVVGADGVAGQKAAFDQTMRIIAHDLAVLQVPGSDRQRSRRGSAAVRSRPWA